MKPSLLVLAFLSLAAAQAAPTRPLITSVSHFAVYSADMAKSDAFYTHNLGAVKKDDPENKAGVRYYFNAHQWVEVLPLPKGYTSVNRMDHAAFNTSDAASMRNFLLANHIKAFAINKGADGSRWFYVNDPEGNRIEFVQEGKAPADIADNPLSDHIIHFGMIVHDEAAMDPFYRTLLSFRPYWFGGMKEGEHSWVSQQVPDGTDWLEYMLVAGPEKTGIPASMPQSTAGVLNHFALGVGNIEKTVTLLTDGERVSERADGPKIGRDGKWQFNMYDPDGTRAEFMEFHAVTKPCCSAFTASDPQK